jgi:hypothetical protein
MTSFTPKVKETSFNTSTTHKEERTPKTRFPFSEEERRKLPPAFDAVQDTATALLAQKLKEESPSPSLEDETEILSLPMQQQLQALHSFFGSSSEVQISSLTPEVLEVFEKMVGAMVVMDTSGRQETSVMLSNPNSPFFGGRITIVEYSTAPKQFNVQIAAAPEAIALYQKHASSLMTLFENGNFRFKINRVDTHLLSKKGEWTSPLEPIVEGIE